MTAQGNPRTVFCRAIERENLVGAELNFRMISDATLVKVPELTALVAKRDPGRRGRFAAQQPPTAARWVRGLVGAKPVPTGTTVRCECGHSICTRIFFVSLQEHALGAAKRPCANCTLGLSASSARVAELLVDQDEAR